MNINNHASRCVRENSVLCWQHPKISNSLEMPRIRVQPNRRDAPYFELTSQKQHFEPRKIRKIFLKTRLGKESFCVSCT